MQTIPFPLRSGFSPTGQLIAEPLVHTPPLSSDGPFHPGPALAGALMTTAAIAIVESNIAVARNAADPVFARSVPWLLV